MSADAYEARPATESAGNDAGRPGSLWRVAAWAAAALVLILPLVAMQFTDEVNWTVFDFVFAAALLLGVGVLFELAVRKTSDTAYRAAVGIALLAALLLVWVNGAVGIIGSEDNPANLMYGGVLAVGIIGAGLARFRPSGMARTLFAAAIAQVFVTGIALIGGLGSPLSGPLEIVALIGIFVLLCVSASLFRAATPGGSRQGAETAH